MKKVYLLLITSLLTITLSFTEVKASNGNEIIPFHPDPSLVTEWNVSELGYDIVNVTFDTPILKIIIPEGVYDVSLYFENLESNALGKSILWIFPLGNEYRQLTIDFNDSYISTIWLGGGQSIIPTMNIYDFYIGDENMILEDIFIYPDIFIDTFGLYTENNIMIHSYNFEYELSQEYQLGYNDGWGEKNKMTDITYLIIGLIIFIIANILGFIYKNNLLNALSGLLWLLPIFLVDNIFIKIFSVIIMLITFLFSFKERGDYYV